MLQQNNLNLSDLHIQEFSRNPVSYFGLNSENCGFALLDFEEKERLALKQ